MKYTASKSLWEDWAWFAAAILVTLAVLRLAGLSVGWFASSLWGLGFTVR